MKKEGLRDLTMIGSSPTITAMTSKRTIKINVLVTPEEVGLLEDVLSEERRRSISALVRDMVREGLQARGKTPPADKAA